MYKEYEIYYCIECNEIIKSEASQNCEKCGKSMKSIGFVEEGGNNGR